METKLFTIVKVGWNYNDEYYYREESGGGTPIKAYRTLASAEEELDKLNGKWLRTIGKDMRTEDRSDENPVGYEIVQLALEE